MLGQNCNILSLEQNTYGMTQDWNFKEFSQFIANFSFYTVLFILFILFQSAAATKNQFYFFFLFQNYVTEPLRDRSFKLSFHKDTCLF